MTVPSEPPFSSPSTATAHIVPTRAGRRKSPIVNPTTIARRVDRLGEVDVTGNGDLRTRTCSVCMLSWTPGVGDHSEYCPTCRAAGLSLHCGSMRGVHIHHRARAPLCNACTTEQEQHRQEGKS